MSNDALPSSRCWKQSRYGFAGFYSFALSAVHSEAGSFFALSRRIAALRHFAGVLNGFHRIFLRRWWRRFRCSSGSGLFLTLVFGPMASGWLLADASFFFSLRFCIVREYFSSKNSIAFQHGRQLIT